MPFVAASKTLNAQIIYFLHFIYCLEATKSTEVHFQGSPLEGTELNKQREKIKKKILGKKFFYFLSKNFFLMNKEISK